MRAYMESLRKNGYDHYVLFQEDEQQEAFYFAAMNDAGDFVSMNYQFLEKDFPSDYDFESLRTFQGYITVVKGAASKAVSPERIVWNKNDYQKMLPKPAYDYKDYGLSTDPSSGESWYSFRVNGSNYWDAVNYAKQLQSAGFTLHQTERAMPYSMQYEWSGENESGYLAMVYTQRMQMPGGEELFFMVRVEAPGTDLNRGWTAWFVPDPGDVQWSGYSTNYNTGNDWYYEWEWDFQQAQEYANILQPTHIVETESRTDMEAETVYFKGRGYASHEIYAGRSYLIIFQYKDGKCTLTAIH